MRIRWVKLWIDAMATLTEIFRDDEGRIDFEALGREEYEFRHALVTGDYSRSSRARDFADAAAKDYKVHSENGKKGGRPAKNLSADATTREGVENESDGDTAANLETSSSAGTETLDSPNDKGKQPGAERAAAKPSRTTPPQNTYGEFQNVKMTTAEFEKLVQAEGADRANALIEELSSYLASSGKRYKSHYATLLNWGRRKDKEGEPKQRYLTTEEISRRNIEESERQMNAILAHRRASHG